MGLAIKSLKVKIFYAAIILVALFSFRWTQVSGGKKPMLILIAVMFVLGENCKPPHCLTIKIC